MKKLGILGGMGPVSTVYFYDLIIKIFQKRYNAVYHSDYPYIAMLSVPIPDNVEDLKQKNKMREELIEAAQTLEKIGVDLIVMPCNTEHIFYKDITEKVSLPVLNIVDETLKQVQKKNCKKLLLLSTLSTIRYGLYEGRGSSVNIVKPSQSEQNTVNKIIYNLLAGKVLEEDADIIVNIIDKYELDGVIVGCTELSLLFDIINPKISKNRMVFDSTKILAEKTVEEILR